MKLRSTNKATKPFGLFFLGETRNKPLVIDLGEPLLYTKNPVLIVWIFEYFHFDKSGCPLVDIKRQKDIRNLPRLSSHFEYILDCHFSGLPEIRMIDQLTYHSIVTHKKSRINIS